MDLIPIGTYIGHAVSGVLSESENKQTPQIVVDFELTTAEVAGRRMPWYGFLTKKTAERTFEALRYSGWKGTDIDAPLDFGGVNAPDVELVVDHEEWEGKTRARIQWVNRMGGKSAAALPPDKAKVIAAKMRGVLAKVDQNLKSKGVSAGSDAIPF